MKFHKLEILEIKSDTNIYYGLINNVSAILHGEKDISDEINLDGEKLITNDNFYKIRLKNNDIIINLYYPATPEMVDFYKNKSKIITETFTDYQEKIEPYINSILEVNTKWIKNILYNNSEAERILFKGEKFIVIKNIAMDTNNDFYLLCIPFEPLKNIRDLEPKHKDLLKLMRLKSLEIGKKNGYEDEDLYFFFHYHPSCYHLHLHVCINNHKSLRFKLYRHVLLDSVLENIKTIKKKKMRFEINISNPIYRLLKGSQY